MVYAVYGIQHMHAFVGTSFFNHFEHCTFTNMDPVYCWFGALICTYKISIIKKIKNWWLAMVWWKSVWNFKNILFDDTSVGYGFWRVLQMEKCNKFWNRKTSQNFSIRIKLMSSQYNTTLTGNIVEWAQSARWNLVVVFLFFTSFRGKILSKMTKLNFTVPKLQSPNS